MAKYKPYSYAQGQFIPVRCNRQTQKDTFEYTLNYLVDNEPDLAVFDSRFRNDETGAPAYDPRILLKIILFAYSRGITPSRAIARCFEENVLFIALSANSRPHFTTIADFISSKGNLWLWKMAYLADSFGEELLSLILALDTFESK